MANGFPESQAEYWGCKMSKGNSKQTSGSLSSLLANETGVAADNTSAQGQGGQGGHRPLTIAEPLSV